MEELKDLIRVSLSGRISGIETFNHFSENKKSLFYKLYSNISRKRISTDDDAKIILYGKDYSGKSYDVLKRRFKERLYTNVLFVQPRAKDTRSYAHNVYFVHKHYIVAKLLLMIAARNAGIRLMEKVFKRSQQYQVTEIALLAALSLKKNVAFQGNKTLYNKYAAAFHQVSNILNAENEAEEKYEALYIQFTKSQNPRPDLIKEAREALKNIEKLIKIYNTFTLHQTGFYVEILCNDLQNNYKSTLTACNNFEKYLLGQPVFYSPVRHGNLLITKLNCYLHLGLYKEGLEIAEQALKMFDSPEGNLLILQEIHFLIALRDGNYILAARIYKSVIDPAKQKQLNERQREIWRIYSGYLWFCLTAQDFVELRNEVFSKTKDFRLFKLLNEVPIYSKDKQGLNLALGVLQFILFVQRKDFNNAIEKAEHLKAYIHKYLNIKNGARDHIMLKLILLLSKNDFNVNMIEKKAHVLLDKLKSLTSREQTYDRTHIEVLPYNILWDMLLSLLK
ncbi:MAG: hypothetical protein ACXWD4_01575 [Bacteroidia bacterium]